MLAKCLVGLIERSLSLIIIVYTYLTISLINNKLFLFGLVMLSIYLNKLILRQHRISNFL
jgi:hypothetical protein